MSTSMWDLALTPLPTKRNFNAYITHPGSVTSESSLRRPGFSLLIPISVPLNCTSLSTTWEWSCCRTEYGIFFKVIFQGKIKGDGKGSLLTWKSPNKELSLPSPLLAEPILGATIQSTKALGMVLLRRGHWFWLLCFFRRMVTVWESYGHQAWPHPYAGDLMI